MRSQYHMLLEQRALMEAQLLEARDVAIKAKFIPLIAKWYDHLNDNQRDGSRDRMIKREMERMRHELNSDDYHEIDPNADDIAKSWGRERVFSMDLWNRAHAEKTIDIIMAADPDRTKSFSTWMCTRFLKDELRLEDLPRFTDALELFGELVRRKKLPVEQRDINRYPDIQSVMAAIQPFKEEAVAEQNAAYEAQMLAQSEVYEDNERYIFLAPKSQLAAEWFGRDTEWCTAWGGKFGRHPGRGSLYSTYAGSPLFILRDKQDEKLRYQLHFATGQFCNVADSRIDPLKLLDLYPGLDDAMKRAAIGDMPPTIGKMNITVQDRVSNYTLNVTPVGYFDTMNGFQALQSLYGKNAGFSIRGIKTGNTRQLAFVQLLPSQVEQNPALRDNVIEILHAYRFRGNCETAIDLGIAYDDVKKKYVYANKAGDISINKTKWKKFASEERTRYALFADQEKPIGIVDVIAQQSDFDPAVIRLDKWPKEGYGKELFTILKAMANRRSIKLASDNDFVMYMSKEDAIELFKLRPDWAKARDRFAIWGDTPATRRRLVAEIEEVRSGGEKLYWVDNHLVFQTWKDFDEVIDEIGTDYAQNLNKYVSGNRHLDYYGDYDLDDYMKKELLQSLSPEILTALFEWMKKEYEGEDMDAIDLDDPITGIMEMDDEFECDELQSAYRTARSSGDESGSLGEMTKTLRRSVENEPHLFFLKGKTLQKDFSWDTKIVIAAKMEDIVPLYNSMDDLNDIEYDGWVAKLLEHEAGIGPRHDDDYSGYDESAAADSFEDAVTDFLP